MKIVLYVDSCFGCDKSYSARVLHDYILKNSLPLDCLEVKRVGLHVRVDELPAGVVFPWVVVKLDGKEKSGKLSDFLKIVKSLESKKSGKSRVKK